MMLELQHLWIMHWCIFKIKDVIVCGHTRCGGIATRENCVKENYIADWLCVGALGPKLTAADAIAQKQHLSPEEKIELLIMENVRVQLNHFKQLTLIRNMFHEKVRHFDCTVRFAVLRQEKPMSLLMVKLVRGSSVIRRFKKASLQDNTF